MRAIGYNSKRVKRSRSRSTAVSTLHHLKRSFPRITSTNADIDEKSKPKFNSAAIKQSLHKSQSQTPKQKPSQTPKQKPSQQKPSQEPRPNLRPNNKDAKENVRNPAPVRATSASSVLAMGAVPSSILLRAKYKASTQKSYLKAVGDFIQWQRTHAPKEDASTHAQLDALLVRYFDYLLLEGYGAHRATLAFCGVVMIHRDARRNLPFASAALTGWRHLKPPKQRPPLTWPLTCAIAHEMARTGHVRAAVACLLAFDCLLRIGEVTALRSNDVWESADVDRRVKSRTVLHLPQTKTGINQSTRVRCAGSEFGVRSSLASSRRSNIPCDERRGCDRYQTSWTMALVRDGRAVRSSW